MIGIKTLAVAATLTAGIAAAMPAAAENVMQTCGAKYQAAKTAKTLPAGQTWMQYLAACRADLAKSTPATSATTAKPTKVAAAKPARTPGQPSPAQKAMYERERQCGAKWRADKAANKVPSGMKWPQYWSQCNKAMK